MKKFKKLIPALCMLLVSAVMLGSTTYAWFSMNKTVTATGMEIKAEVSTQLLIKGSKDKAEYKSTINFASADDSAVSDKNTLTSVPAVAYKGRKETASKTLINGEWKKIVGKSDLVKEDGTISGGTQDSTWDNDQELFGAATAGKDYIKDQFTLKLVGEFKANSKVKLTVEATAAGAEYAASGEGKVQVADIYKAIHVAFVSNDSDYIVEYDMGEATLSYDNNIATLSLTKDDFDPFTEANQEHAYTVYIWYDGEDEDCKNANAASIDKFAFNFKFEYNDTTVGA